MIPTVRRTSLRGSGSTSVTPSTTAKSSKNCKKRSSSGIRVSISSSKLNPDSADTKKHQALRLSHGWLANKSRLCEMVDNASEVPYSPSASPLYNASQNIAIDSILTTSPTSPLDATYAHSTPMPSDASTSQRAMKPHRIELDLMESAEENIGPIFYQNSSSSLPTNNTLTNASSASDENTLVQHSTSSTSNASKVTTRMSTVPASSAPTDLSHNASNSVVSSPSNSTRITMKTLPSFHANPQKHVLLKNTRGRLLKRSQGKNVSDSPSVDGNSLTVTASVDCNPGSISDATERSHDIHNSELPSHSGIQGEEISSSGIKYAGETVVTEDEFTSSAELPRSLSLGGKNEERTSSFISPESLRRTFKQSGMSDSKVRRYSRKSVTGRRSSLPIESKFLRNVTERVKGRVLRSSVFQSEFGDEVSLFSELDGGNYALTNSELLVSLDSTPDSKCNDSVESVSGPESYLQNSEFNLSDGRNHGETPGILRARLASSINPKLSGVKKKSVGFKVNGSPLTSLRKAKFRRSKGLDTSAETSTSGVLKPLPDLPTTRKAPVPGLKPIRLPTHTPIGGRRKQVSFCLPQTPNNKKSNIFDVETPTSDPSMCVSPFTPSVYDGQSPLYKMQRLRGATTGSRNHLLPPRSGFQKRSRLGLRMSTPFKGKQDCPASTPKTPGVSSTLFLETPQANGILGTPAQNRSPCLYSSTKSSISKKITTRVSTPFAKRLPDSPNLAGNSNTTANESLTTLSVLGKTRSHVDKNFNSSMLNTEPNSKSFINSSNRKRTHLGSDMKTPFAQRNQGVPSLQSSDSMLKLKTPQLRFMKNLKPSTLNKQTPSQSRRSIANKYIASTSLSTSKVVLALNETDPSAMNLISSSFASETKRNQLTQSFLKKSNRRIPILKRTTPNVLHPTVKSHDCSFRSQSKYRDCYSSSKKLMVKPMKRLTSKRLLPKFEATQNNAAKARKNLDSSSTIDPKKVSPLKQRSMESREIDQNVASPNKNSFNEVIPRKVNASLTTNLKGTQKVVHSSVPKINFQPSSPIPAAVFSGDNNPSLPGHLNLDLRKSSPRSTRQYQKSPFDFRTSVKMIFDTSEIDFSDLNSTFDVEDSQSTALRDVTPLKKKRGSSTFEIDSTNSSVLTSGFKKLNSIESKPKTRGDLSRSISTADATVVYASLGNSSTESFSHENPSIMSSALQFSLTAGIASESNKAFDTHANTSIKRRSNILHGKNVSATSLSTCEKSGGNPSAEFSNDTLAKNISQNYDSTIEFEKLESLLSEKDPSNKSAFASEMSRRTPKIILSNVVESSAGKSDSKVKTPKRSYACGKTAQAIPATSLIFSDSIENKKKHSEINEILSKKNPSLRFESPVYATRLSSPSKPNVRAVSSTPAVDSDMIISDFNSSATLDVSEYQLECSENNNNNNNKTDQTSQMSNLAENFKEDSERRCTRNSVLLLNDDSPSKSMRNQSRSAPLTPLINTITKGKSILAPSENCSHSYVSEVETPLKDANVKTPLKDANPGSETPKKCLRSDSDIFGKIRNSNLDLQEIKSPKKKDFLMKESDVKSFIANNRSIRQSPNKEERIKSVFASPNNQQILNFSESCEINSVHKRDIAAPSGSANEKDSAKVDLRKLDETPIKPGKYTSFRSSKSVKKSSKHTSLGYENNNSSVGIKLNATLDIPIGQYIPSTENASSSKRVSSNSNTPSNAIGSPAKLASSCFIEPTPWSSSNKTYSRRTGSNSNTPVVANGSPDKSVTPCFLEPASLSSSIKTYSRKSSSHSSATASNDSPHKLVEDVLFKPTPLYSSVKNYSRKSRKTLSKTEGVNMISDTSNPDCSSCLKISQSFKETPKTIVNEFRNKVTPCVGSLNTPSLIKFTPDLSSLSSDGDVHANKKTSGSSGRLKNRDLTNDVILEDKEGESLVATPEKKVSNNASTRQLKYPFRGDMRNFANSTPIVGTNNNEVITHQSPNSLVEIKRKNLFSSDVEASTSELVRNSPVLVLNKLKIPEKLDPNQKKRASNVQVEGPKVVKRHSADYTNVVGLKRLLNPAGNSPISNYNNLEGVSTMFASPTTSKNERSNQKHPGRGVKKISKRVSTERKTRSQKTRLQPASSSTEKITPTKNVRENYSLGNNVGQDGLDENTRIDDIILDQPVNVPADPAPESIKKSLGSSGKKRAARYSVKRRLSTKKKSNSKKRVQFNIKSLSPVKPAPQPDVSNKRFSKRQLQKLQEQSRGLQTIKGDSVSSSNVDAVPGGVENIDHFSPQVNPKVDAPSTSNKRFGRKTKIATDSDVLNSSSTTIASSSAVAENERNEIIENRKTRSGRSKKLQAAESSRDPELETDVSVETAHVLPTKKSTRKSAAASKVSKKAENDSTQHLQSKKRNLKTPATSESGGTTSGSKSARVNDSEETVGASSGSVPESNRGRTTRKGVSASNAETQISGDARKAASASKAETQISGDARKAAPSSKAEIQISGEASSKSDQSCDYKRTNRKTVSTFQTDNDDDETTAPVEQSKANNFASDIPRVMRNRAANSKGGESCSEQNVGTSKETFPIETAKKSNRKTIAASKTEAKISGQGTNVESEISSQSSLANDLAPVKRNTRKTVGACSSEGIVAQEQSGNVSAMPTRRQRMNLAPEAPGLRASTLQNKEEGRRDTGSKKRKISTSAEVKSSAKSADKMAPIAESSEETDDLAREISVSGNTAETNVPTKRANKTNKLIRKSLAKKSSSVQKTPSTSSTVPLKMGGKRAAALSATLPSSKKLRSRRSFGTKTGDRLLNKINRVSAAKRKSIGKKKVKSVANASVDSIEEIVRPTRACRLRK